MEQLLEYFDLFAVLMAAIATSLLLAVINQTKKGKEMPNALFAVPMAVAFAVFLTDWTDFGSNWQSTGFKFSITTLGGFLLAVTRGQRLVDNFLSFLVGKLPVGEKGSEGDTSTK